MAAAVPVVPRAKRKYRCMAQGCHVVPRGCDLPTHYRVKTDWDLFTRMKAAVGDAALEKLKETADPHTMFVFCRGYCKERLPTYATHVVVKERKEEVHQRVVQQKQHSLTHFFQVCFPYI